MILSATRLELLLINFQYRSGTVGSLSIDGNQFQLLLFWWIELIALSVKKLQRDVDLAAARQRVGVKVVELFVDG